MIYKLLKTIRFRKTVTLLNTMISNITNIQYIYISPISQIPGQQNCFSLTMSLLLVLGSVEIMFTEDPADMSSYFKWRLNSSMRIYLNNKKANTELRVQLNGNTSCHNNYHCLSYRKPLENTAAKIKNVLPYYSENCVGQHGELQQISCAHYPLR